MSTLPGSNKFAVIKMLLIELFINGVCPYLIFVVLNGQMGEVPALIISALPPAALALFTILRHGRPDAINLIFLAAIILTILINLVGGSARLILVRDSFITGGLGIAALISLLFPRPALFYLARAFNTANDPVKVANFNQSWVIPYFRHVMRVMTIVWGVGFIIEAGLRISLVFQMSTRDFLAISPFIQWGFYGGLMGWTLLYRRMATVRTLQIREQMQTSKQV